ncbi:gliding motility-associated C-terminal domain-containing protein [Pedobacter sp. MC2016-14]|uniref:gliding motility-associated C-terminal domain-containing protein n=1 Tax=Pedobacter sp. MC2016-14 TaxID=2897327 RepID=UPI001E400E98|nr:gliding motility-associated C-terminal domain-containing protein [Pedobacter sp. MC2016-14]MCD0488513.1 gliding motility-associated C-terminal domain-containing protein [Pedobacter sp. MC2016-14]
MKFFSAIVFLFSLLAPFSAAKSQAITCHGAFGDVLAGTTFNSGPGAYGPELNAENTGNYNYVMGAPNDGAYTLVKTTAGMRYVTSNAWHLARNHTPNDPNGYMMVINADINPGIFYQEIVSGLCPGTTYQFSAWVINLLISPTGRKPNLTFSILNADTDELLAELTTGDIPVSTTEDWQQKKMDPFVVPSTGSSNLLLRIRNNGVGGSGNDLALDDIAFQACGPSITTKIDNSPLSSLDICVGDNRTFTLSADVESFVYSHAQYQWQRLEDEVWQNLPGETNLSTIVPAQPNAGASQYRLLAAENGNIDAVKCRSASPVITITTYPYPSPTASNNGAVCVGGTIMLDVDETGTDYTYAWTGPNGFTSSEKRPTIPNATPANAGLYSVTVTNKALCATPVGTTVTVLPLVNASVGNPSMTKCESDGAVQLEASGGTFYTWSPAEGLSATNIPNPLANPKITTRYTVKVSNGGCEESKTVDVVVKKNATANAGADRKIFEGESTILNGFAGTNMDGFSFYWTPTDGLDDPNKLNPVATPIQDITYTLHVNSDYGCIPATDDVFIRVFQKVTVPNTFSPNGDGVNDLWNIKALNSYPEATLKVMNREGQTVFSGTGTGNPWNGKYNGQDLPVGAYYYTITLNPELKKLSGWVMIVR